MNRQLIFALMAGTHHHRYTDASGQCSTCHKEHSPHEYEAGVCTVCGFAGCEHPEGGTDNGDGTHVCPVCGAVNEHVWFADPTETRCQSCEVCEAELEHSWHDGVCSRCSYECAHPDWIAKGSTVSHFCTICGKSEPHSLSFTHKDSPCQICSVCGGAIAHDFPNRDVDGCGTCTACKASYSAHKWDSNSGMCVRCGYSCLHPAGVDSEGYCTICGRRLLKPDATYYIWSGTYAGSYVKAGSINGQSYYRQYVWRNGGWAEGSYYMVVIRISSPTQFGGNYAYTGSGAAFVTSVANFPINDTLLSGSGKYHITLKQYELDGTFKAEGSYTSPDCANLSGVLP